MLDIVGAGPEHEGVKNDFNISTRHFLELHKFKTDNEFHISVKKKDMISFSVRT